MGESCIEFIDSEHQLADVFTKSLAGDRFFFIRNELGILDGSSIEWWLSLVHAACYIRSLCLLIFFKCLSMLICWCVVDFLSEKYLFYFDYFMFFTILIDYFFVLINYNVFLCVISFFETFCFDRLPYDLFNYHLCIYGVLVQNCLF